MYIWHNCHEPNFFVQPHGWQTAKITLTLVSPSVRVPYRLSCYAPQTFVILVQHHQMALKELFYHILLELF